MLKVVAKICDFVAMAENMHSINLIPNKGKGLLDQFLSWALTIGRLLIILTETLALGTFLYRFSIDMRIIDLHDLIKNQSIIVSQFKSTEETARNLHTRLAFAKDQEKEAGTTTDIFSDVVEMGRGKVTFKNILVSKNSIKIEVQAQSSSILNSFVNGLKNHPEAESVSIESIENKTSGAVINMNITVNLKQAQAQSPIMAPSEIPGGITP